MAGALDGKVAIITGGSAGLGAASVDLFVREGAKVVIADFQIEAGEARATASDGSVAFIRCDVMQEDDIAAMVAFAKARFGGLDILFNNAGSAGTLAPVAQMDAEGWDAVMALIPRAAVLGMKHAYPLIKARGGGSIINTASIAGMRPGISNTGYSVAKAAVLQLTRMAAVEFAPDSIRVNTICPGIVPTQALGGFFGVARDRVDAMLPQVYEIFNAAQPIPRSGRPEDIARTALFLASDASSWTTGQEFVVDGGMMLMGPGSLEFTRPDGVLARTFALAGQVNATETAE
ncbi:glucose 1-dehydrogenase [soil metagenome]